MVAFCCDSVVDEINESKGWTLSKKLFYNYLINNLEL
jgi:hypothetical protein